MFNKLCFVGVLGLAGYGGYKLYKSSTAKGNPADDDYFAGISFGLTGWVPQLPIHPRSKVPTQGVFNPVKVSVQRGKAYAMVPARDTDYVNPAQMVPTTGPGNLAPIPGVNTSYINDVGGTANPYFYTEEEYVIQGDTGSLTMGGVLPPIPNSSGYKSPNLKVG